MSARRLFCFGTVLLAGVLAGCSLPPLGDQGPLVRQAFEGFKDEIALGHARQALDYLDRPTLDFLQTKATHEPSGSDPEVEILIRRAAQKLTPGGVGPNFSLEQPVQRLLDQNVIGPSDLTVLVLGPVTVDATGRKAQAEALWFGRPTTLQIYFVRDDSGAWKIDLFNLLKYASSALNMDRLIKRETQDQQIDRLVGMLPNS